MATREELGPKIIALVAEHMGKDKDDLTEESKLQELGGDSLDSVEITIALEEEFGIEIPDAETDPMSPDHTIGDIITYMVQKLGAL
jgi:acyl carrier protein